jgi:hypothetical protein
MPKRKALKWLTPLSFVVETTGNLRSPLVTLGDAAAMIADDLPDSYRSNPHWAEAADLLMKAAETADSVDVDNATQQLMLALYEEGWLEG